MDESILQFNQGRRDGRMKQRVSLSPGSIQRVRTVGFEFLSDMSLPSFLTFLDKRMPRITGRHPSRHVPILHEPKVRLYDIIYLAHLSRRESLPPLLIQRFPLGRVHIFPQIRFHTPRLHKINAHWLQFQRQAPYQPVQPCCIATYHGPVFNRPLGDAATRYRDAGRRPRGEVAGADFGDKEGREETQLSGLDEVLHSDVLERHRGELVARSEDDVVKGADFLEKSLDFGFDRGLGHIASIAGDVSVRIGFRKALQCGFDG
jgi:hypothetical protein